MAAGVGAVGGVGVVVGAEGVGVVGGGVVVDGRAWRSCCCCCCCLLLLLFLNTLGIQNQLLLLCLEKTNRFSKLLWLQSLVEQWKKQDEPKERWPLELVELLGSNGVISPISSQCELSGLL